LPARIEIEVPMNQFFNGCAVVAALLLFTLACQSGLPVEERPAPQASASAAAVDDTDLKTLVADNNRFALDLYARLRQKPGNLFFSPYSISSALAMTYAGSRNRTETEMAGAMHYSLGQERLHPAFAALGARFETIRAKNEVEFTAANALWPHKTYQFLPEYLELNRRHYGVEITPVDYVADAEGARRRINDWVEGKTAGKIKDLIGPDVLDSLTRLVLTNAIYFKGSWLAQFEKDATRPMPFRLDATRTKDLPTMFRNGAYRYHADETLQALELPYKGDDLSMIVLLPRAVDGLAAIEKDLDADRLAGIIARLREAEVNVFLPKFSVTSQFGLSDILQAMGMKDAFSMAADFSGMDGTTDLLITAVIHKAFVAVDEEGTEAAAATAVVIGLKSMPMIETFRADHPFLFLIREKSTGAILFLGRVTDPAS
jgi:serpin B